MSAVEFPSEFPCPLVEGTSSFADPSLLRADLNTGSASQRRRNRTLPHVFRLSWVLPQADDYGRLIQWINRYGFDWFTINLPSALAGHLGVQTTKHTVRIVSTLESQLIPTVKGFYWRISLQVEWDPAVDGLPIWDGLPSWPAGLPCPLVDPTTASADPSLVRVEFEGGNTRQRRFSRQLPHMIRLSWIFPQVADYAVFVRWANAHGWDWFTLQLPSAKAGVQNEQLVDHRVRFMTELESQLVPTKSGYYWTVSVDVQWQPMEDGLGTWTGGQGVWIIGGTADAPSSPDWVLAGEADQPSSPDWVLPGDPRSPAVLV